MRRANLIVIGHDPTAWVVGLATERRWCLSAKSANFGSLYIDQDFKLTARGSAPISLWWNTSEMTFSDVKLEVGFKKINGIMLFVIQNLYKIEKKASWPVSSNYFRFVFFFVFFDLDNTFSRLFWIFYWLNIFSFWIILPKIMCKNLKFNINWWTFYHEKLHIC